MKHPHHDMIQEWIKDIDTGRVVQRLFLGEWIDDKNPGWYLGEQYRFKPEAPKFITVNGIQVPEPVREPLERGHIFWLADPTGRAACLLRWVNDPMDYRWLSLGLIHLTREAAQVHIDAMLLPSRSDK